MQEKYKDKGPNFKCKDLIGREDLEIGYVCGNNDVVVFVVDMQMDVRNMDFEPKSFDCVIDKGLLDSILVNILNYSNFKHLLKSWMS